MNTNLTRRGTWLFAGAVTTLGVGVLAGEMVIAWLGCCLILALALTYGASVASALVLDRRFVAAEIREVSSPDGHGGYVVGDDIEVDLAVVNRSALPLFGLRAEPYGPEALHLEGELAFRSIGAQTRVERPLQVRASCSGRWMLQGFDLAVTDPFGVIEVRDYLPCNFAFEFYPSVGRLDRRRRNRRLERRPIERDGRRQRAAVTTGTVLRQLREYEPGDPLRHVAWKATARTRKLISREFEDEISAETTILLDISGSMRGGAWQGQKLEHAVELTAGMADELIADRHRVGLMTFDEKIYGYLPPGSSRSQYHRILHHLLGLHSIVDPDLTELEERELRELVVDYLLVQERLDFRSDEEGGRIDGELLERWVRARLDEERRLYHSPVLREGLLEADLSPVREFVQLRGLPVPYRVESRLGPKGRGMAEALERSVHEASSRQSIVVVSDLCGVSNFEVLEQGLALAHKEGHQIRFLVPFTPSYFAEESEQSDKREILMELFTASERQERMRGVQFLERKGIRVDFIGGGERDRSVERPAA